MIAVFKKMKSFIKTCKGSVIEMKTLETQRLILRELTLEDLSDFHEYASMPEVADNAGWRPHSSMEESRAVLMALIDLKCERAIVLKESSKVIGSISIKQDPKRRVGLASVIGYSLSKNYWGMGLMTEAVKRIIQYGFEEQALKVISAYHFQSNQRSQRVIEKAGLVLEGRMRCAYEMYDGTIHDDCCYSILREEYFLRKLAE